MACPPGSLAPDLIKPGIGCFGCADNLLEGSIPQRLLAAEALHRDHEAGKKQDQGE